MDLNLTGRKALVTGASAGIGRATAEELAREGTQVALVARGMDRLQVAAREIEEATGNRPATFSADLSTAEACENIAARMAAEMGGLDILVNSVPAPVWGSFISHSDKEWEMAMQLKFLSYVRTSRAAIPLMSGTGRGVIINVIGIGGRMPLKDHLAGGAANAALMLLTAGLAKELAADRIRVVGVNPGPVATERLAAMTEQFRQTDPGGGAAFEEDMIASPADVGGLVTFLASDRAHQINGTTVTQDGGLMSTV